MGTDLTGFIERKLNDKWGMFAAVGVDRNYRLYSCISDWRFSGEYKSIEPKGIPDDASYQITRPFNQDMGRSGGTWLTLAELNQAHFEYMRHDHEPVPDVSAIIAMMEELCKVYGYDGVRYVFWLTS